MARFMLLIHSDDAKWDAVTDADQGAIMGEYFAYTKALEEAGVLRGGDPLHGADTAKIVAPGGVVTDGPFAESAEHLGGYYLVEVPDIDEACSWAAKLPGVARGIDRIEVREIQELPGMDG